MLVALPDVDNALAVYRTDQARAAALDNAVAAEQAAFDLARDRYRKDRRRSVGSALAVGRLRRGRRCA